MFVARQALSGCIDYCFGNSIYWFILPAQIFERYFNLSRQRSIRKFHYNDLAILVLKFTRVAYKQGSVLVNLHIECGRHFLTTKNNYSSVRV